MKVLIRYNNENTSNLFWRVIIDGKEHAASEIVIWCPTHTSENTLEDGRVKHHICCFPKKIQWEGTVLTIS